VRGEKFRKPKDGWWFEIFLCSPLLGEDFQFDQYFSDGLKPPTRKPKDGIAYYQGYKRIVFGSSLQHL